MFVLYILNEILTNGYKSIFLDVFALISIICGIFVIICNNPIVSVLFLIGLFLSISSYLITLGIGFIGLSYLLVYVGAVSILFLFILMLINIRISELLTNSSNGIPLAIILGILFNYLIHQVLPHSVITIINFSKKINSFLSVEYINVSNFLYKMDIEEKIFFISSKLWEGYLFESTHITSIGNILYTNYSI